jgi:hypothetical protein
MPKLNISETKGGVEFEVIAKPKARKDALAGTHDGAMRVAVSAAPEKGRANQAVIKLLARLLDVPASAISIVSGEISRRKRVRAEGVTVEAIIRLVEEARK